MTVSDAEQTAITEVVQAYIDGSRSGDADQLRRAFHPDARMYGSIAGQRIDAPIEEFFALASRQPADVDGTYEARIVSIEQVGDAATAAIEETGFWGTLSFTDFFALSRFEGEWKMVNKTFAHTGGEPPRSEPRVGAPSCVSRPSRARSSTYGAYERLVSKSAASRS
jgi:putative lumazine-binding protein